jgi:predicted metal-dependent peptidase
MELSVNQTAINLLIKEPFFGHFLTHFQKKISKKTDSIAIDINKNQQLLLLINETYWKEELETQDLKNGEIKHQLLHLIFGHLGRSGVYQNDALFGIAADLTINQLIDSEQLTSNAIIINKFKDIDLPKNQTLNFYYKQFLEILIEPKFEDTTAKKYLQKILVEGNEKLKQHRFWGIDKTAGEQKIIENKILKSLETAFERFKQNNDIGTLGQSLESQINQQVERLKPKIDWRRRLRLFTNKSQKTFIKNTIRRPSKRYGTVPGITVKKRQKLLIAIDTSASVSEKMQSQFFEEVYHIWRQNAVITIVECDITIQRTYEYEGEAPEYTKGKGGTDYNEPIRYANEILKPDAIIYFTDGKGEKPTIESKMPILWLR